MKADTFCFYGSHELTLTFDYQHSGPFQVFIEANNSLTINHTQANQVLYCNVFVVQVIMYSMCEDYVREQWSGWEVIFR